MNGQIRMNRKIQCRYYDGKTNYNREKESLEEIQKR